jgi:hypothetical protein
MRTAIEFSAWRVDAEMRTSVVVLKTQDIHVHNLPTFFKNH